MREWWVFALESHLGHLKEHVKNRFNPEASIFRRLMFEEAAKLLKVCLLTLGIVYRYAGEVGAVNELRAHGEVAFLGKPQSVMLERDDIGLIERALEKEWSSDFKALKRALQSNGMLGGAHVQDAEATEELDGPPPSHENQPCSSQSVWEIARKMDLNKKEEFQGRQRDILAGVRPVATAYRACEVREMQFRASWADAKTVYAKSGVAMDPSREGGKIGVIKRIVLVHVRNEAIPFLKVSW